MKWEPYEMSKDDFLQLMRTNWEKLQKELSVKDRDFWLDHNKTLTTKNEGAEDEIRSCQKLHLNGKTELAYNRTMTNSNILHEGA